MGAHGHGWTNRPSEWPELLTVLRTLSRVAGRGHRPANQGEDATLVFALLFNMYFLRELGFGSPWRAVLHAVNGCAGRDCAAAMASGRLTTSADRGSPRGWLNLDLVCWCVDRRSLVGRPRSKTHFRRGRFVLVRPIPIDRARVDVG
jgi:hypothetical protein